MCDHSFCRASLRLVMDDVKKVTTPEQRKQSSGYKYSYGQTIEFHGPDGFYWHGRGCCVWLARAEGWSAWLKEREEKEKEK